MNPNSVTCMSLDGGGGGVHYCDIIHQLTEPSMTLQRDKYDFRLHLNRSS